MWEVLYSWKFSSKKERSAVWYMIALSVVIGIVIWWFITRQYGLSLVLLLAAGIVFYVENNSEDEVSVNITEWGIQLVDSFYDFSKINQYIFMTNGNQTVMVRFFINKWRSNRFLDIDIDSQVAQNLKNILPNFLPEWQSQELSITDKIIHLFNL
jgi:hypothetical protein